MIIDIQSFPYLSSPATQKIFHVFKAHDVPIRFVGGCVRDALLGVSANDIDLAVPIDPQGVIHILQEASIKVIPTGLNFGTVTAVLHGESFQITSLRQDVKTFGRHAVVSYGSDWHEDAARRDFTFNALYADEMGYIYDDFNGIEDLFKGHVRFIGDPLARIQEDYLRILRYFRFYAWYGRGAPPNKEALEACHASVDGLALLSQERITTEFMKLLSAPHPADAVAYFIATRAALYVIDQEVSSEKLNTFLYLESKMNLTINPIHRYAALILGTDLGNPVNSQQAHTKNLLRLSRKDNEKLAFYTQNALTFSHVSQEWPSFLYRLSTQDFVILVHLNSVHRIHAGEISKQEALNLCREAMHFAHAWAQPRFPVTGQDLLRAGISRGEYMGKMMKACEKWWIVQKFEPTKEECIQWILDNLGSVSK